MSAAVTYRGILDMQVCVPRDWSDPEATAYAEAANPCGTTGGWHIRRQGNPSLGGAPERVPCADREGYVHIMLDA